MQLFKLYIIIKSYSATGLLLKTCSPSPRKIWLYLEGGLRSDCCNVFLSTGHVWCSLSQLCIQCIQKACSHSWAWVYTVWMFTVRGKASSKLVLTTPSTPLHSHTSSTHHPHPSTPPPHLLHTSSTHHPHPSTPHLLHTSSTPHLLHTFSTPPPHLLHTTPPPHLLHPSTPLHTSPVQDPGAPLCKCNISTLHPLSCHQTCTGHSPLCHSKWGKSNCNAVVV